MSIDDATPERLREMIRILFDAETAMMNQQFDCERRNDHAEAAICYAKRGEYLDRAKALIERLP